MSACLFEATAIPITLHLPADETHKMQRLIGAYASLLGIPFGSELTAVTAGAFSAHDARANDAKVQDAIAFVEAQRQRFKYPGLTLAVVRGNETLIAKGFGTKQLGVPSDVVDADTLFEIGSISKTHVALALAKLVDDGKLQWHDTIKSHLPWFKLQDKYAEEVTTIADLASHNSVFGDHTGDEPQIFGAFASERVGVEKLRSMNTTRKVRPGFAYSNVGFNVLGQVIEAVSNQTWGDYLTDAVWRPWGMHSTFAHARLAPASRLAAGHNGCAGTVIGPYPLQSSPLAMLSPNVPALASGSIVSTATDMANLLKQILAKGGHTFKSPQPISDMVTGHVVVELPSRRGISPLNAFGLQFKADGTAVTSGYGVDFIGELLFGHRFYMKNGATKVHTSTTGFVPDAQLGLYINANMAVVGSMPLELIRSYVLGIFLDVPKADLDAMYELGLSLFPPVPAAACDAHYFGHQPWATLNTTVAAESPLAGTYLMETSPDYYGPLTVRVENGKLRIKYGAINALLLPTNASNSFIVPYDTTPTTLTAVFELPATAQDKVKLNFSGLLAVHV
ncbi:beta-lactamase [Achlya hypogyna]|uniref:Beta-lactamase n=1 Tax=Achlya hypogyna TaxID=1202772 RepID=A0A1V9YBF1_ACHHY|nr:beta-lactamase [Achlya hypogyna]